MALALMAGNPEWDRLIDEAIASENHFVRRRKNAVTVPKMPRTRRVPVAKLPKPANDVKRIHTQTRAICPTDPKEITKECAKHGHTSYVLEGRGYYRCRKCRSDKVTACRRRKREQLRNIA